MESLRAYLCGLKPNLFKTELKKFRRYVLFKVNKELKDVPPSLYNFLVETRFYLKTDLSRTVGWSGVKWVSKDKMGYPKGGICAKPRDPFEVLLLVFRPIG